MNPLIILAAVAGVLLLASKKSAPAVATAVIKAPTAKSTGSVKVTVPSRAGTTPPTTVTIPETTVTGGNVVTLPETTITGRPVDNSWTLTADEQSWLLNGTNDEIYQQAVNSNHPAFIAAAGLALVGKGDPRALEVSQLATQF